MSNNSSAARGGIGFTGLLAILFIAFKLLHIIDWRWRWVLAPLWAPVVLFVVFLAVVFVIMLIGEMRTSRRIKQGRAVVIRNPWKH